MSDENEECDDGLANSDHEPDLCRTNCQNPSCGDAVRDTNEECDDGNHDDGDGCSANCLSTEVCGNSVVDVVKFEDCDTGALRSDSVPDACRTNCSFPSCGDLVPDTGEQCDGPVNSDTLTLTKGEAYALPDKIPTDDGPVTVFDPGFPLHWKVA